MPTVDETDGPTALRMSLGHELRGLREACGMTRDEASEVIRGSSAKISRMELGRVGLKPRDVVDLLKAYGVVDSTEQAQFLDLVRRSGQPGWWYRYTELLPPWFETYLGLEQAASIIRSYECQFVPGLLQTPEYAFEVIRLGHPDRRAAERRVELRVRRQAVLDGPEAPLFWAVVDEAALSRPLASTSLARAQISHLLALCERPNVRLQIAPFDSGGLPAAGGAFSILRFPQPDLPDVVYLEQLTSSLYLDKRSDVEHYIAVMDRLAMLVPPPEKTADVLVRIRDRL